MPGKGREFHDLRAAVAAFAARYPKGRGRSALDDEVKALLKHADAIMQATEPAGRGDDGEDSPGQRSSRSQARGAEAWYQAAAKLGDDSIANINAEHRPGVSSGGAGTTPGMRAAAGHSDAYRFRYVGEERGKQRDEARGVYGLRDAD